MLYWGIIAVCSEIHTKHTNTLCGQKEELLNVKNGGAYSDHCTVHIVTTGLQKFKVASPDGTLNVGRTIGVKK